MDQSHAQTWTVTSFKTGMCGKRQAVTSIWLPHCFETNTMPRPGPSFLAAELVLPEVPSQPGSGFRGAATARRARPSWPWPALRVLHWKPML